MNGLLRLQDGDVLCARCELAVTPRARMRGLLGRSSLSRTEGMLFRPAGAIHTAFMRFAIDAVFCDRDLNVLGVERALRPWRIARRRGTKVVVELAAGAAKEIEPGDRLVFEEKPQESPASRLSTFARSSIS